MIKMIVCDMDNTLLNSKKEISPYTHDIIKAIMDRGIHFVPASGRSRESLMVHFQGMNPDLIASNGGVVYDENGDIIFIGLLEYEDIKPAIDLADATDYMHMILIAENGIYLSRHDTERAIAFADHYFHHHITLMDDIRDAFQVDQVVKLSINTNIDGPHEAEGLALMKPFEDQFSLALAGDGWIDFTRKDASKGTALERLCDNYGITLDEVAVFGDHFNDLEMLKICKNSYCMSNGHPDVKKECNFITEFSNNEDGVAREIVKLCDLKL